MERVIDHTERSGPAGPSRARGQVGDFHRAYGLPVRTAPTAAIGPEQVALRQALIEEEVRELADAARLGDVVGVADALADIVYVAYGTAHVYGIDLDAVLDEVHSSNMTKLGADGRPVRRADGKVLKGPDYRPPDVRGVLARAGVVPAPAGPASGPGAGPVTVPVNGTISSPAGPGVTLEGAGAVGWSDTGRDGQRQQESGAGQEGRPWAEPSPPG